MPAKPTRLLCLLLAAPLASCRCGSDAEPAAVTSATPPPAPAPPPTLPPGRSPVPSPAEYAAVCEVTVKGSTALHCETKMLREWLRVSCRGKSDTGGTPSGIVVVRGGSAESITYAGDGATSLITPVLEGTDFEARFSWTDKSHPLRVRWPHGAPRPIVVGEFLGAASPLDAALDAGGPAQPH